MQPRGDQHVGINASRDNWRTCSYFYCCFVFQCKVTVPKMGSIQDLCSAVASLLKVAPDKVKRIL